MTNNPTIDGVPREDLRTLINDPNPAANHQILMARDKVRRLLDTPAVERQGPAHPPHPYGYVQNPVREDFEQWAAEESEVRGVGETIGLSTDEHHDRYSMIWTQTSWMAWQACSAALQSTIAQLQALLREADDFMYIMTGDDTQKHLDAKYGKFAWEDAIVDLRGRIAPAVLNGERK